MGKLNTFASLKIDQICSKLNMTSKFICIMAAKKNTSNFFKIVKLLILDQFKCN